MVRQISNFSRALSCSLFSAMEAVDARKYDPVADHLCDTFGANTSSHHQNRNCNLRAIKR